MILRERIEILDSLGKELKDILSNPNLYNFPSYKSIYESNTWFTEEFVRFSLTEWSDNLNSNQIIEWLSRYNISNEQSNKVLGIVMAGNLPLVGFHDLI
ncbi:MAG: hypothetical protein PHW83_08210, partial [Bacteroidales bacterium]|nr:hypothetical protein [Bacteroidales bacterium]